MVTDTIILLSLFVLLAASSYLVYKQVYSDSRQNNHYIDALERQIKENNKDITILGNRLAEANRGMAPQRQGLERRTTSLNSPNLKPSSQGDLLLQLSILESKLQERDQRISFQQVEISRFQMQRKLLIQRDEEINALSAELAQARAQLNDALDRLKNLD